MAIVTSSMTFLCLYISRWWRQTWDTAPYFTVVNQSEARISTEHGINVYIIRPGTVLALMSSDICSKAQNKSCCGFIDTKVIFVPWFFATQSWLMSHDWSWAVPRLATTHWMNQQHQVTIPWLVIVQPNFWPMTDGCDQLYLKTISHFQPKTDHCKSCVCKRKFSNLNDVTREIRFCGYCW